MELRWVKDPESLHTWKAETIRYRFVMVAPPRTRPMLWVQLVSVPWGTNPIDHRACRTRRGAERIAQRFENTAITPRRLR